MRHRRLAVALLLCLLPLALPGRVSACSQIVYTAPPSEPQAVAAAERIVLARAVASAGEEGTYEVEEELLGDFGTGDLTLPLTSPCWSIGPSESGKLYLFFLSRSPEGEGWETFLRGGDFPANREVTGPDDPLVTRVRAYAKIAELGDEATREEALDQLRREADRHPERYPAGLAEDLDRHFRFPTPYSPFSQIRKFYEQALYPEDRLEALWDMIQAPVPAPEKAAFLRARLASGEDLGEELWPILIDFEKHGEPGDLDLLVTAALRAKNGLTSYVRAAEDLAKTGDDRLVWTVLRAHLEAVLSFHHWFEEHPPTPPRWAELLRLYRRLPEVEKDRLAANLLAMRNQWLSPRFWSRLILEGDDPASRTARLAGHPAALVRAYRAARSGARRRVLLFRLLRDSGKGSVADLLPLLPATRGGEAALLLSWLRGQAKLGDPIPAVLTSWLASARSTEEAEHALWAVTASLPREVVLREAEKLAARLPLRAGGGSPAVALLARAARSCPEEEASYEILSHLVEAAGEDDRPLLLGLLFDLLHADPLGAVEVSLEALATWFIAHPDPEAIPALTALLERSVGSAAQTGDPPTQVASALAAAGDPVIVRRVLGLLERRATWASLDLREIVAHSPLPEAAAALRRLDRR